MRRAFQSLGVCLQAIAYWQQLSHQTVADAVTASAQFLGQFAHALTSPAQCRLRVTTAQRLDQRLQISHQRLVLFSCALTSSAGFADASAGRHWRIAQLDDTARIAPGHSRGTRDNRNTTVIDGQTFRSGNQAAHPPSTAGNNLSKRRFTASISTINPNVSISMEH